MSTDKVLRFGVAAIAIFLLGAFLKLAKPILIPFALALAFSFALSPVLESLIRLKVPRTVALVLVLLLTFLLLYLIGSVFYAGGKSLAAELPSYNEMMRSFLEGIEETVPDPRLQASLKDWLQSLNIGRLGSMALGALGPFVHFMSQLLLVFVFMVFILGGRGRLVRKIGAAFPPGEAAAMSQTARRIDSEIQRYMAVKTLINLTLGVLVAAALALFGVRFPVVFGVLAFLFNYVPTLGAVAAVVPPVLLAAFLDGAFSLRVVLLLILLAAFHLALAVWVEPRLMGRSWKLPPLLVLFSLFFGAWLWGVPGMILAVPALAALKAVAANVPALRPLESLMGG